MKLPPIHPARQQLIITTHLTLGYLYYEMSYYREAISHFRRITADREEYAQALLAASWTAFKAKNFQDAITTLNALISRFEDSEFSEEAHFLLGQAYLELGFFDFAEAQFDFIVGHFPETNGVAERLNQARLGIQAQEKILEKMKINLLLLESKLIDMIPLRAEGNVPDYIEQERARLAVARERLLQHLADERESFERLSDNIDEMRQLVERLESRHHWRAYAEYGKTRAHFLKGMSGEPQ